MSAEAFQATAFLAGLIALAGLLIYNKFYRFPERRALELQRRKARLTMSLRSLDTRSSISKIVDRWITLMGWAMIIIAAVCLYGFLAAPR